jgi:hypothetical protein
VARAVSLCQVEESMRWGAFMGIALFALVVIAVSVGRVIRVVNLFAPASAGEPQSIAAAPFADDPVNRSVGRPSEAPQLGPPQALSQDLDETLRTARGTRMKSKRSEPESLQALPETALDQDLRPVMAEMQKLNPADPAARVEDLARKAAPTLARETLDHSADTTARNPEVEHELLETLKEQKQILAGKRETVDSVLKDTAR